MQTRCNVFILARRAPRTSKRGLFLRCDIWILMRTFAIPLDLSLPAPHPQSSLISAGASCYSSFADLDTRSHRTFRQPSPDFPGTGASSRGFFPGDADPVANGTFPTRTRFTVESGELFPTFSIWQFMICRIYSEKIFINSLISRAIEVEYPLNVKR